MTTKVLSDAEARLCILWCRHFAAPLGYVDCPENAAKIHGFLERNGLELNYDNLTYSMESQRNNLIGLGVATTPAMQQEIAKREADKKAAELEQQQADHNNKVAANFIKNHCPTGLIVGDDFYGATSDKIVAFIKHRYPGQLLENFMLKEAIETLWNSLDFFDKSPEALVFRNVVKAPRVLSEKAKIEAGLLPQRDLRSHANDGELVDPNVKLREMLKKTVGKESPDEIKLTKSALPRGTGNLTMDFALNFEKLSFTTAQGQSTGKRQRIRGWLWRTIMNSKETG